MFFFGIDDLLGFWRYRLFLVKSVQPVLKFLRLRSVVLRLWMITLV